VRYAYVDGHRERFGVEPICRVLQVAPSGYGRHAARVRSPERRLAPERRPARVQRDEQRMGEIERVWQAGRQVYGARKVWRQLLRKVRRQLLRKVWRQLLREGCRWRVARSSG